MEAAADGHVFVRSVAPHVQLAGHASVHQVISATFAAAGTAGRTMTEAEMLALLIGDIKASRAV